MVVKSFDMQFALFTLTSPDGTLTTVDKEGALGLPAPVSFASKQDAVDYITMLRKGESEYKYAPIYIVEKH